MKTIVLAFVAMTIMAVADGVQCHSDIGNFGIQFNCDDSNYLIEGAATPAGPWFPLKTITPGTWDCPVAGGAVSAQFPRPLLPGFGERGFVRVSKEVKPPDPATIEGSLDIEGDHLVVTFDSTPNTEYLIEAAQTTNGPWIPVDTLQDGVIIQSFTVLSSAGNVSDIQMPDPPLPWLKPGWVFRVSQVSQSGSLMRKSAAVFVPKRWRLFCAFRPDVNALSEIHSSKYIGGIFDWTGWFYPEDCLGMSIYSSGPLVGVMGKYAQINTRGSASAIHHSVITQTQTADACYIPTYPLPPPAVLPDWQVFVALSTYTGDSAPSVVYVPDGQKADVSHGDLQFHLETRGSQVIAVATWNQKQALRDGISVSPYGIGSKIGVTDGSANVTRCHPWAFSPMDDDMIVAYYTLNQP